MLKKIVYCLLCSSFLVPLSGQPANAIPLNPILDQLGRVIIERSLGINSNSPYPVNIYPGGSINSYPSNYPPQSSGQPVVMPQEQNPYNTYAPQPYQQLQQPYYPQQIYPQQQQPYYPNPQPFIYNPTFVFPPNQSSPPVININNH